MWSWRIDIIECTSFGYGASGGFSFMYISRYIEAFVLGSNEHVPPRMTGMTVMGYGHDPCCSIADFSCEYLICVLSWTVCALWSVEYFNSIPEYCLGSDSIGYLVECNL